MPGATPPTYAFTTAYDLGGRLLSQAYPDGDSVGPLAYDAAGRLKSVPNLLASAGILYDARGNQTNLARLNGATTVMTYSPERGWLLTLAATSTAGTLQNYSYTRDARGRINAVASPQAGDGWTYGYDDLDRLLSADNLTDNSLDQTFTYDLVGNMATNSRVGTYAYPAQGAASVRPHATTGISGGPLGSQSFLYDANGSMTSEGGDTRAYDSENRLITAVDGTYTTSIVYGPDGARLKKTVTVSGGSSTTTLYFGDDVELTVGQYLKYLPGDAKKVGSGGSGTLYWQHRDHLQSVRVVTKADGTKDDGAAYRPYGEQLGFAGTTPQTKGFIGQRLDDKSGLMYLHARYYDPVLGRFLSADPSDPTTAGVGVNRYAYAANNPIALIDPTGLIGLDPRDRQEVMEHREDREVAQAKKTVDTLTDIAINISSEARNTSGQTQRELQQAARDIVWTHEYMDANATLATFAELHSSGWRAAQRMHAWASEDADLNSLPRADGSYLTAGDIVSGAIGIALAAGKTKEAVRIAKKAASAMAQFSARFGSYTIDFASGMKYHGKGPWSRALQSAKRIMKQYGDPDVDIDWSPAPNKTESFKDEARRIMEDGGIKNLNNYNMKNSPGAKMLEGLRR